MVSTTQHAINTMSNKISEITSSVSSSSSSSKVNVPTVGQYLARYLYHIGIRSFFGVAGDYNLALLDELIKPIYGLNNDAEDEPKKIAMYCNCNELNAGYSADGYARLQGISCLVVTHSVGSLSCINAVAGAYAEHVPVIVVNGGLNSNAQCQGELVHHSLAINRENQHYDYVRRIYEQVTASAVTIQRPHDAPTLIHKAIKACLQQSLPVYIDIACNIATSPITLVNDDLYLNDIILPSPLDMRIFLHSDNTTLQTAVKHTVDTLNHSKSPVIIVGQLFKQYIAYPSSPATSTHNALLDLIHATQYPCATLLDGKTLLPESDPQFLGIYLHDSSVYPGQRGVNNHSYGNALKHVISNSDMVLYIGAVFSDYASTGHTAYVDPRHMICVDREQVKVRGNTYHDVEMYTFIQGLLAEAVKKTLKPNDTALGEYQRLSKDEKYKEWSTVGGDVLNEIQMKLQRFPLNLDDSANVTVNTLSHRLQEFVDHSTIPLHIVAETGDAWFTGMKLKLPPPHKFEIQLQYGSIGWSVGVVLGLSVAAADASTAVGAADGASKERIVGLIGDGSFQLTAQEISTIIRYELNPIILLLNNHDYVIEEQIHPGPYNRINNWHYSELPHIFDTGVYGIGIKKKPISYNCRTVKELNDALTSAQQQYPDRLVFIEIQLDPKDSNIELAVWAKAVSKNSQRSPHAPSEYLTLKPYLQPNP